MLYNAQFNSSVAEMCLNTESQTNHHGGNFPCANLAQPKYAVATFQILNIPNSFRTKKRAIANVLDERL